LSQWGMPDARDGTCPHKHRCYRWNRDCIYGGTKQLRKSTKRFMLFIQVITVTFLLCLTFVRKHISVIPDTSEWWV